MLNLMEYKEAKEFLESFPELWETLNNSYRSLLQYDSDSTVRTMLTELEQGMDRLHRKYLYYTEIVEKK